MIVFIWVLDVERDLDPRVKAFPPDLLKVVRRLEYYLVDACSKLLSRILCFRRVAGRKQRGAASVTISHTLSEWIEYVDATRALVVHLKGDFDTLSWSAYRHVEDMTSNRAL